MHFLMHSSKRRWANSLPPWRIVRNLTIERGKHMVNLLIAVAVATAVLFSASGCSTETQLTPADNEARTLQVFYVYWDRLQQIQNDGETAITQFNDTMYKAKEGRYTTKDVVNTVYEVRERLRRSSQLLVSVKGEVQLDESIPESVKELMIQAIQLMADGYEAESKAMTAVLNYTKSGNAVYVTEYQLYAVSSSQSLLAASMKMLEAKQLLEYLEGGRLNE